MKLFKLGSHLRILFVVLLAAGQSRCTRHEQQQANTALPVVNDLPAITLMMDDQSRISARDLSGKAILIFYRAECDHCQREAIAISEHFKAFLDYQLYFVGTDGVAAGQKFAHDYELSDKGNVHFVQTGVNEILNTVGTVSTPSIFIYSDKKLIKHLDGETPIDEIVKYL